METSTHDGDMDILVSKEQDSNPEYVVLIGDLTLNSQIRSRNTLPTSIKLQVVEVLGTWLEGGNVVPEDGQVGYCNGRLASWADLVDCDKSNRNSIIVKIHRDHDT